MIQPEKKPYIVILAGGGGTRLWPKSRKSVPKQFLRLFSKKTLLQDTYSRVAPLTDNDKVLIVASQQYSKEILDELPDLDPDNLVIESCPKGTAAAIGLASAIVNRKDPTAVVHFISSDHYIPEIDEFQRALLTASIIAEKREDSVLWGIHPTSPAISYEYIQSGEELDEVNGIPVFKVKGFKERPNISVAQAYVASGTHFWNHGNFSQKNSVVLKAIQETLPELYLKLENVINSGEDELSNIIAEIYNELPTDNKSFDIGVMVNVKNIVMIPVAYEWSDIGNWDNLYAISEKGENANSVVKNEGDFISIDTHGCLIHANNKLIATVGLSGMIVVDSDDVMMICPMNRVQEVKKLLEVVKNKGREDLL